MIKKQFYNNNFIDDLDRLCDTPTKRINPKPSPNPNRWRVEARHK